MARYIFQLIFVFIIFIAPQAQAQIALSDKVTVETANTYLDSCMNKFPKGFTPKAHRDFCNCSAANMREYMTNSDLTELNKNGAKKAGNKAFEKYAVTVAAQCMAMAVSHIGYVGCLEDKSHNPYIENILPYCQCTALKLTKFTRAEGASAIIINMTQNPKYFTEPTKALLESAQYKRAIVESYHECKAIGRQKRKTY